jgi:hypothetical protein
MTILLDEYPREIKTEMESLDRRIAEIEDHFHAFGEQPRELWLEKRRLQNRRRKLLRESS